ncbi:MAG: hypothetical protein H0U57_03845 [Tatlockia sp.]|nr:hypothetical protein [Tatlockia sp.]
MKTKVEGKRAYQVVTYVKDTNEENGPGHVSVSLMKQKNGNNKISHTSFYTGILGSFINGVSFGSVPVPGIVSNNHEVDMNEAEHVLVKDISREQYKSAKMAQQEFSKDVAANRRIYSVFGSLNPLSLALTTLLNHYRNANLTAEKHKEEHSCYPPEDHCGLTVYDIGHVEEKVKIDNCSSSVTHVLNGAGFKFKNPVIPTFFTDQLQDKHEFKSVEKSEFISKFGYSGNTE